MPKICLILSVVVLMFSRATRGSYHPEQSAAVRQQTENYFAYAYGYTPSLWNSLFNRFVPPVYVSPADSQLRNFVSSREVDENETESRLTLDNFFSNLPVEYNSGLTTQNTWGQQIKNVLNLGPLSVNPNVNYQVASFDSCTSGNGDAGICASRSVCFLLGGRSSGTCNLIGLTCCVNTINTCNGAMTLNNTYWKSPATTINAPSTCTLTVTLDNKRREQIKPICQVRLDFISFTTAQPATGTCTDTFEIGGSSNVAPTICGDNSGQHMYLDVQSSAISSTDLTLKFNFAVGTTNTFIPRSWNIKVAILPCGASYLAPKDCLQYFTSSSGRVSSFNWQDISSTATRQLNNQNYRICFRTELINVNPTKANQICLSVCTVKNGGDAFYITTVPPGGTDVALNNPTLINFAATLSAVGTTYRDTQQGTTAVCLNDYLLIPGGRDSTNVEADRYCGNQLNPAAIGGPAIAPLNSPAPGGSTQSVQVCSSILPFRLVYRTDGTEGAVTAVAASNLIGASADTANTGFCLDFQEK